MSNTIAKKLRELADNVESGHSIILSVEFGTHYEHVFNCDDNKIEAYVTGDDCVTIRIKGADKIITADNLGVK